METIAKSTDEGNVRSVTCLSVYLSNGILFSFKKGNTSPCDTGMDPEVSQMEFCVIALMWNLRDSQVMVAAGAGGVGRCQSQ